MYRFYDTRGDGNVTLPSRPDIDYYAGMHFKGAELVGREAYIEDLYVTNINSQAHGGPSTATAASNELTYRPGHPTNDGPAFGLFNELYQVVQENRNNGVFTIIQLDDQHGPITFEAGTYDLHQCEIRGKYHDGNTMAVGWHADTNFLNLSKISYLSAFNLPDKTIPYFEFNRGGEGITLNKCRFTTNSATDFAFLRFWGPCSLNVTNHSYLLKSGAGSFLQVENGVTMDIYSSGGSEIGNDTFHGTTTSNTLRFYGDAESPMSTAQNGTNINSVGIFRNLAADVSRIKWVESTTPTLVKYPFTYTDASLGEGLVQIKSFFECYGYITLSSIGLTADGSAKEVQTPFALDVTKNSGFALIPASMWRLRLNSVNGRGVYKVTVRFTVYKTSLAGDKSIGIGIGKNGTIDVASSVNYHLNGDYNGTFITIAHMTLVQNDYLSVFFTGENGQAYSINKILLETHKMGVN